MGAKAPLPPPAVWCKKLKNFVKIDEPRTYFDVLCKQNSVSYWYKKKLSWQHLLVREEDELLDDKRTLPPSA